MTTLNADPIAATALGDSLPADAAAKRRLDTPSLIAAMLNAGKGISDLIFSPGRPPQVESHGELTPVPGLPVLQADDTAAIARDLVGKNDHALRTLKEHGASEVWLSVTHALLNEDGLRKLGEADVAGIVVTDSVPIDPLQKPDNMTVLTVAPLLAETIMNVFEDASVSAIFGGENQLF